MKRRQFLTGAATLAAYGGLARAQSITPQIGGGISKGFDGGISGAAGASVLWTPSNLGSALVAWWDAQDNAHITLSGSTVTSWVDKVGGIAATNGVSGPTFSATARNGKPGITSAGSQSLAFSPATLPLGNAVSTIAVAAFLGATNGSNQAIFSYGAGAGANDTRAILMTSTGVINLNNNTSSQTLTETWNSHDRFLEWLDSGPTTTGVVDGNAPEIFNWGITNATASTSGQMFQWPNGGSFPAAGTLQQILVFNTLLTLQQRRLLEGWESWYDGKAGANLPTNHPFKSHAPLVSDTFGTGAARQIANITSYPEQFTTGSAQVGVIQPFAPVYDMYSVQIVIPNCAGEDASSGGTLSATASLEYPSGVFTPITFAGSGTGSTSGLLLTSDIVNLTTPVPTGVAANIRIHGAHTNSTFGTSPSFQSNLGYVTQFGATVADVTAGGTLTNTAANLAFGACVIAGRHNSKAVAAFGDSICFGTGATGNNNNTPVGGVFVPSLFGLVPTMNAGLEGSTANGLLNNGVARKAAAQFFTSVASNFGTNDLAASGRTAAQLNGDIDALIASYAPIPFYQGTITPRATSTDNFATAVNQTTVLPFNTDKNTVNAHIRSLSKHLLTGDALEDGLGSGIWKNPGDASAPSACTDSDGVHAGLHPTQAGYNVVQGSGAAAPSVFT